jgi:hypothetical protein
VSPVTTACKLAKVLVEDPKAGMTRRQVLAGAMLASCPVPACAQPAASRGPVMPPSIRPATPQDLPAIVALLTQDARERAPLDPLLWRIAPDDPTRIEKAVGAALNDPQVAARELWHVAEDTGRVVGVTHAMLVPVPPIYDSAAGAPGLLCDDCFMSAEAHRISLMRCSPQPRPR